MRFSKFSVLQAHLIWIVSIVNIGLGFVIPGFDVLSKSISYVALEAPVFSYTHRVADVVIGASMCIFAIGINLLSPSRVSFAAAATLLFGLSMASAGIWTLESPLHLLYNLSIFMIVAPISLSLEFKNEIKSPSFEIFSLSVSFLHVVMFWMIYAGFIPSDFNGLIQRIWAVPTMGWYGIASYLITRRMLANNSFKPNPLRGSA